MSAPSTVRMEDIINNLTNMIKQDINGSKGLKDLARVDLSESKSLLIICSDLIGMMKKMKYCKTDFRLDTIELLKKLDTCISEEKGGHTYVKVQKVILNFLASIKRS
jgi:hypothetical protein